jgi:hypothetical protein
MVKKAYDNTMAELEPCCEDDSNELKPILLLLRDNLTFWTSDLNNVKGNEKEQ